MDLAGPLQVLLSANSLKSKYAIRYIGPVATPEMQGGLAVQSVEPLPQRLPPNSRLMIPGIDGTQAFNASSVGRQVSSWLSQQRKQQSSLMIITVCSGAIIAAKAGLLINKRCTTHHDLVNDLKRAAPKAKVERNRLYVNDSWLWTSAGISSGIDMMLAIIERDFDAAFTALVARDMVIYLRRGSEDPQLSPWLIGRNHVQSKIHQIQDKISQNLTTSLSINELAKTVGMSPRNLTRQFLRHTQQTIHEYREQIKIAQAASQLKETTLSIEHIAENCGFGSSRSFRRAWGRYFDYPPSQDRSASE